MEGTAGLKTTSVTDDVIDWPLPNKIIGCVTASDARGLTIMFFLEQPLHRIRYQVEI